MGPASCRATPPLHLASVPSGTDDVAVGLPSDRIGSGNEGLDSRGTVEDWPRTSYPSAVPTKSMTANRLPDAQTACSGGVRKTGHAVGARGVASVTVGKWIGGDSWTLNPRAWVTARNSAQTTGETRPSAQPFRAAAAGNRRDERRQNQGVSW